MRVKQEYGEKCKRDFIFVKSGPQDHVKINYSEILFISSLDDYIQIHLKNSKITSYSRLKDIKKRLPSSFIQSHRSYIVNFEHVNLINAKDMELHNGMEIPISASYRDAVKKQIT